MSCSSSNKFFSLRGFFHLLCFVSHVFWRCVGRFESGIWLHKVPGGGGGGGGGVFFFFIFCGGVLLRCWVVVVWGGGGGGGGGGCVASFNILHSLVSGPLLY